MHTHPAATQSHLFERSHIAPRASRLSHDHKRATIARARASCANLFTICEDSPNARASGQRGQIRMVALDGPIACVGRAQNRVRRIMCTVIAARARAQSDVARARYLFACAASNTATLQMYLCVCV